MTEQPLHIAFVGCGRVTESCHLPALHKLGPRVRVVAVADVDAQRRAIVAGAAGIRNAFPTLEEMLRNTPDRIDAVAVCTPASAHADGVEAALAAGKHVLLEKPIAMTLGDADRIVAAAAAHEQLVVTLGFNLRQHRLVRKARELIGRGLVGEMKVIRTIWGSGIRYRMAVPAWRNRRSTGGGVLFEMAVHHFDLIRHLTGAQVLEVSASAEHGQGDDESAAVTLRLSNGAMVSCLFTERGSDANEIELMGPRGRLGFSLCRFDSMAYTPRSSYSGRKWQIIETLKDLPAYVPILRRGGDFVETYRQEWLAFINAVRGRTAPAATVEDGREALRCVLAAQASCNTGRPVNMADVPGEPPSVPGRECAEGDLKSEISNPESEISNPKSEISDLKSESSGAPLLTAIIATRGRFEVIRHTIRHLRAQTIRNRMQILIVCPAAAALDLDEAELDGFGSWRMIEVGPITSIARANAAGVRAAASEVIVLCEDHAFPEAHWAEALVAAHRGPYAAVGPIVSNANPSTTASWADCLIGYGPWLEPIAACEPTHLPGHNCSYKRDILLSYGDRLDEMMESETVLQWDLRAQGHRLYLEPLAHLAHTNFALWGIWTKVQFHAGRMFGATRALNWPLWKRAIYTGASPLIPLVRLRRAWGQARRISAAHRLLPRVLPALAWGLIMDGIGQMAGYSLGAGRSRQKIADYEFERVRYITEQDRRELESSGSPVGTRIAERT